MPRVPAARLYLHPVDYFSVCMRVRARVRPPPPACLHASLWDPSRPLLHDAAVIQSQRVKSCHMTPSSQEQSMPSVFLCVAIEFCICRCPSRSVDLTFITFPVVREDMLTVASINQNQNQLDWASFWMLKRKFEQFFVFVLCFLVEKKYVQMYK